MTVREHLEAAAKSSPMAQLELEGPPCPEACEHLWSHFVALHATRGAGFGGALPITFAEIEAYSRVGGVPLRAWEVQMLRRADTTALKVLHEQAKPKKGAS